MGSMNTEILVEDLEKLKVLNVEDVLAGLLTKVARVEFYSGMLYMDGGIYRIPPDEFGREWVIAINGAVSQEEQTAALIHEFIHIHFGLTGGYSKDEKKKIEDFIGRVEGEFMGMYPCAARNLLQLIKKDLVKNERCYYWIVPSLCNEVYFLLP